MTAPTSGDELRKLILQRYRSVRQFALAIGMPPEYISKILKGRVSRPGYENLARMAEGLDLQPTDLLAIFGGEILNLEAAPQQLTLMTMGGDEELDTEAIVAYVESRPGQRFQEQLRHARDERTYLEYVEFCVSIFRAWESNSDLGIKALQLGRRTGTDGL